MDPSDYLTLEEVGKRFRSSKWTVRRWVEAGKLPAVRVGRRWLIPAEAVERVQEQQLSPADLGGPAYQPVRIVRGPAPRYEYFERAISDSEADRLAKTIVTALQAGGWPQDTFTLRREGVRKIILGQEIAPPAVWRYLADGIQRLQAAGAHANVEEAARTGLEAKKGKHQKKGDQ